MTTGIYCLTPDEHRANAILTALRSAGFSSEISVLIGDEAHSRDMSVKEDAVRGAKVGTVVGALVGRGARWLRLDPWGLLRRRSLLPGSEPHAIRCHGQLTGCEPNSVDSVSERVVDLDVDREPPCIEPFDDVAGP